MHYLSHFFRALFLVVAIVAPIHAATTGSEVLAHWRFDQIKHLRGDSTSVPEVGKPLSATERGAVEPQPYVADLSGKGNVLQVRGSKASTNVFSANVPSVSAERHAQLSIACVEKWRIRGHFRPPSSVLRYAEKLDD